MLLPANRPSARYLDFLVTLVPVPARQPAPVQRDLVSRIRSMVLDCWDVSYSNSGLEQRILDAHWVALAHRRGHVFGFASGRYLDDLEIDGKTQDAAVLDAVVVHQDFQRFGIASRLVSAGILETARAGHGAVPPWFQPITVVLRTGSKQGLFLAQRFLKGVVGPGRRPDPAHQRVIEAVSKRLGWHVDDWNIDTHADGCLEDGGRLADLREHEALVAAGDLTPARWWLLQWLFAVQYPARYFMAARRRGRGLIPVPSAPGAHLMLGSAPEFVARASANRADDPALSAVTGAASSPVGRAKRPEQETPPSADDPLPGRPDPFFEIDDPATLDPFAA